MSHHDQVLAEGQRPFPLFPLVGAGTLVLISLVSAAWMQWFAKPNMPPPPPATVIAERQLAFEDTPQGEVLVRDAVSGELISTIEVGGSGFVRSTLRGLVRSRRLHGKLDTTPFILEQHANGQLLLIDPVTEQAVDLWAFGQTNAQVFAGYLPTESQVTRSAESAAPTVAQSATRSNENER
jgi:putative photosynthetic complex assembly protein